MCEHCNTPETPPLPDAARAPEERIAKALEDLLDLTSQHHEEIMAVCYAERKASQLTSRQSRLATGGTARPRAETLIDNVIWLVQNVDAHFNSGTGILYCRPVRGLADDSYTVDDLYRPGLTPATRRPL